MNISEFMSYYNLPKPQRLSEERRERIAERFFNYIDKLFMNSNTNMSQETYDKLCALFKEWEKLCDNT